MTTINGNNTVQQQSLYLNPDIYQQQSMNANNSIFGNSTLTTSPASYQNQPFNPLVPQQNDATGMILELLSMMLPALMQNKTDQSTNAQRVGIDNNNVDESDNNEKKSTNEKIKELYKEGLEPKSRAKSFISGGGSDIKHILKDIF